MKAGKLPTEWLDRKILGRIAASKVKRPEVLLRPKVGEDAAILDLKDEHLIVASDPITGASQETGYLAVHINCNDVYATGGEPVGIILTILLPTDAVKGMLEDIMSGALRAAEELGIEILGGHTEFTDAVNRPLVSGTVIGKSIDQQTIQTATAQVGDRVMMTKFAGLEGSVIIAHDHAAELAHVMDQPTLARVQAWKSFISIKEDAKILRPFPVTAMHDATEGGILGAAWELVNAAGLGVRLNQQAIPVKEETQTICQAAHISPYELISSGCLLFTVDKDYVGAIQEAFQARGLMASVIGEVVAGKSTIETGCLQKPLASPQADALYQVDFKDLV